ncbi:anti-sigma factor family protein [Azospirillum sp. ST 5-10]|uniref:anti-sigma factor family protein n=1 Tax=unclassified Azospirillum TaxID=2630922 RepID=UPI003F4A25CD
MSVPPISEDDLHAYVDGALEARRQADVEAYLDCHPEVARRVALYRAQRDDLRAMLAPVAEEPVPPELNLARLVDARRARLAWWRQAAAAVLLLVAGGIGGWSLNTALGPPREGIAALAAEAADSYRVYVPDRSRPVELRDAERAELVAWASHRLRRPVSVPDLSAAGYRFMGGRLVATPHGPAVLFMYDDDRGTRLVMLVRPMASDRDTPMAQHTRGSLTGFAWSADGIGYSLVGPPAAAVLHPIADTVRRQLG